MNARRVILWPVLTAGVAALCAAGCGQGQSAGTKTVRAVVTIAAAADLKFALDEILVEFCKQHPDVDVKVAYGSSGSFFAQLSIATPFDLYLSADIEYPRQLAAKGLAAGPVFEYARGRLAVWAPAGSKADLDAPGMAGLAGDSVRTVAIANPRHAPYGRAAVAAMKQYGVYEKLQHKLVLGENVAQAAQFAQAGAVDAGVIALSLAMAPAMKQAGRFRPVPPEACPPIVQGGIIMKAAAHPAAARMLRDFVLGPDGRGLLQRNGLGLPGE
ncbi:MAG: molybdate ABC transporter substrate-binding protein [Planctomycetota bacterium]